MPPKTEHPIAIGIKQLICDPALHPRGWDVFQEPSAHGSGAEGCVRACDQAGARVVFHCGAIPAAGEPDADGCVLGKVLALLPDGASVIDRCFVQIETLNDNH